MRDLSEYRVLIVDDVKANIDALVTVLQGDYKLSVALSGEAALKAVEKSQPDLIMLDVMMPGIDGFEVCSRLREKPAHREIPVMFLTGLQDVTNKARGFEVGGNDYLTKPFEALEVRARVKAHLTAKAFSDAIKEKMANEMRIARDIQTGILPTDISGEVRGTGFEVAAKLEPAREVGGDLYVVIRNGSRIVVAVGDVSGKGVPAAIFMAVTTTLIRTIGRLITRPEEILKHVNDELAAQNPHGMFVTIACAVIDPEKRLLTYASAAHPSPVLIRPGQPPSFPFPSTGMMAGLMPGVEITALEAEIRPGDTLLFYSDGVTEAFNMEGEAFGDDRLLDASKVTVTSLSELVSSVSNAVTTFAGECPQSDDITLLAIGLPGESK